ncbi:MAG: integration host factor subunit alpha [Arsenophonus sp.]|nr:MAG: integration host factor subunit alpha [Arsenophonus sp.]
MALTKAEISEDLFKKLSIKKCDAKNIVNLFFENISFSLENGEQVKLSGFGNFSLRNKTERLGRNPKTGESIFISARRVVTFRAGKKLKNQIKNTRFYK